MLDADAACSHFDAGCTAVQAGDVNYEDASLLQLIGGGKRESSTRGNPVRTRRTRIHQAVGPATAEATAECRSMNQ